MRLSALLFTSLLCSFSPLSFAYDTKNAEETSTAENSEEGTNFRLLAPSTESEKDWG